MDTLAMFLFGWLLVALFVLWLGRFIYGRFVAKTNDKKAKIEPPVTAKPTDVGVDTVDKGAKKSVASVKSAPAGASGGYVPPTPPVRKRITRQSPAPEVRKTKYVPAPQCTGPDNVVVLWVNDVFQWLYNDFVIVNELVNVWIQSLNDYTKKAANDVSTKECMGIYFRRVSEVALLSLRLMSCSGNWRHNIKIIPKPRKTIRDG